MRRALTIGLTGLALGGCSLLGLSSFQPPTCEDDSDCLAVNEALDIDPATDCMLYQCTGVGGACVLRERDDDDDDFVSIACGGDDCDDTDRNAFPGAPLVARPVVTEVDVPAWVHYGRRTLTPGLAATFSTGGGQVGFDVLRSGAEGANASPMGGSVDAEIGSANNAAILRGCRNAGTESRPFPTTAITPGDPGTCTTHEECQNGSFCDGYETCDPAAAGTAAADAIGCRPAPSNPCSEQCDEEAEVCVNLTAMPVTCAFAEVATAFAREDEYFAAEINRSGCAAGKVMVGWASTGDQAIEDGEPGRTVLLRGGMGRAPGFTGIDLTSVAPACTGGKRGTGAPTGASGLAIASLPADPANGRLRPQALVGWQAAPACRHVGTCGSEVGAAGPVGIETIGAWLEQHPGGANPIRWVSVTGSGSTHPLGTFAVGTASPSIIAVNAGADAGYLVAYAADGGGMAARFVPAFGDPEYAADTTDTGVLMTPPYPTLLSSSADARNRSRATPAISDLGAEAIFEAGGGAATLVDHVVVAVAVEEGAAVSGPVEIMLAWVEGGAVWAAAGTLDPAAGTIDLDPPMEVGGADATEAAIAYVAAGVCGPECGGFAITWADGGQARLARFDEAGGAIDTTPVALGSGASHVQAFGAGTSVRVAWHSQGERALVVSNGQCPPGE